MEGEYIMKGYTEILTDTRKSKKTYLNQQHENRESIIYLDTEQGGSEVKGETTEMISYAKPSVDTVY